MIFKTEAEDSGVYDYENKDFNGGYRACGVCRHTYVAACCVYNSSWSGYTCNAV